MYPNRIYIIGFMASGKTTVGKILAEKIGYEWIDADAAIASQEGTSISELFNQKGEAYFRKKEQLFLKSTFTKNKIVVSTGGGMPCFFDNSTAMKKHGAVVFLKVGIDSILERLKGDNSRPMAIQKSKKEMLALYKLRMEAYSQAHMTVLGNREAEIIVKRILFLLRML